MWRLLVMALLVGACGSGDKCERVYAKMATALQGKGALPGGGDKDKVIAQCREGLKKHPEQEKMIDCLLALPGTPSVEDLGKCAEKQKGGFEDYKAKSKKTEAAVMLNKLGKNAKVAFITNNEFPKGKVGLTPATECCGGPGGKCAVDPKAFQDPVWQAIDFQIDEPHLFRYSYDGDGKTFTALAVGDVDCDGKAETFTLKGSSDNNGPKIEIIEPQ